MMKWIRTRMSSLKVRILWPVVVMMVVMVLVLIAVVTRTYTNTILQQEDAKMQSSFAIMARTFESRMDSAVKMARDLLLSEDVERYAAGNFARSVDRVLARQALLEELTDALVRQQGVYGVIFIREDGSAFGLLPYRSYFFDDDSANTLNPEILERILGMSRGSTAWFGPMTGAELYRMKVQQAPDRVVLGVTVSQSLSYGKIYSVAVVDAAELERSVDLLTDGRSSVYLTSGDGSEIARSDGSRALSAQA